MNEHHEIEPEAAVTEDLAPTGVRSFNLFAAAFSLGAFAFALVVIYAYAAFAEPWVNGLDETIGEVMAHRARLAADAGDAETAKTLYEQAIQQDFGHPLQRLWALQRYADLLIAEGEFARAIEVAEQAVAQGLDTETSYAQLLQANMHIGAYSEAVSAAERLFEDKQSLNRTRGMAEARYQQGVAYRAMGDADAALAAFSASHAIEPSSRAALAAARLLVESGRADLAAPFLVYATVEGSPGSGREARRLAAESDPAFAPN